ncbi:MAG: carboxypeptidase regulatory-like domain-containing protein [Planctomycetes bacterium]|nr:carboxypeptidase regulatory-like domain-containing protein [Planctomycetota bacterium]
MSRALGTARWGAVAAALAAAAGCGGSYADVAGKVTYQGRPVAYGTVSVIGVDKKTYYGVLNQDGTFTVPGVPVGPAKLGVYSPDPYFDPPIPAAEKAKAEEARRASGVPTPLKPPKGAWFRLPGKYADPLSSGLTAEVTAPPAVVDLRLD